MDNEVISLVEEFKPRAALPPKRARKLDPDQPWTVVLTGSTGTVGTYLLATLLSYPKTKVRKVYCLNRAADARDRHAASFAALGLPDVDDERAVFLTATFGLANFGLDGLAYGRVLDEATMVIHNAWPVDFLLPLAGFRPHLRGVVDLLALCHSSRRSPSFLFVSSIASSSSAAAAGSCSLDEVAYRDFRLLSRDGYSRSKRVAEQLVDAYARSSGLPAAILRLGQIAGPVTGRGMWTPREWFPTVVRASLHFGVLPRDLGLVDDVNWIPVDVLATILIEVAEHVSANVGDGGGRSSADAPVFNVCNPASVRFANVLPALTGIATATVSFAEWINLVEAAALASRAAGDGARVPAAKLVSFLRQWVGDGRPLKIQTANLAAASATARALPAVNHAWMTLWLSQWGLPTALQLADKPRL